MNFTLHVTTLFVFYFKPSALCRFSVLLDSPSCFPIVALILSSDPATLLVANRPKGPFASPQANNWVPFSVLTLIIGLRRRRNRVGSSVQALVR
jgi:hypothetical protein